jgi:hypothetical protein
VRWRPALMALCVGSLSTPLHAETPAALAVTSNLVEGRWLAPSDRIELTLSRTIDPRVERLVITIGRTDWTGLFERVGLVLRYQKGPLPLPSGDSVLTVVTVSAEGSPVVAQWPLRVLTARGFERAEALPAVTVDNKGQVAEAHAPESAAPPRTTFQDASLNLGFRTTHVRNGVTATSQINMLAVTHRPEAPRFQQEGSEAPLFDLTDYVMDLESRRIKLWVGHLVFNSHRHLMPQFASRGVGATLRAGRAELTVASVNGQSIVGFDNPFGVSDSGNRLQFAKFGAELASRPGAARVEALFVAGSRAAKAGFTQGQVNDVERGGGLGLRFASAAPGSRVRFDAGVARSRFEAAPDPLLSNGATLVPLRTRPSDAAYLDLSYDLLRPSGTAPARATQLSATYRFERVDPLYRPIGNAPSVRADLLLHTAELSGGWGALLGQVAHSWSHDNLGRVSSLLRTDTQLTTANLAIPLGALRTGSQPATAWWPLVTWTLNSTSQVGGAVPADGGFATPAQVPDQRNTLQTLRSEWTFSRWRLGYGLSQTFVDNRQPTRTTSDFDTIAQVATVGLAVGAQADLTFELGLDRATSRETSTTAETRRVGLNGNWRPTTKMTVTFVGSRTLLRDPAASVSDVDDVMLEGAYTIPLPWRSAGTPRAKVFTRWTWQSADIVQVLFGTPEARRNWALATGLSLSVF